MTSLNTRRSLREEKHLEALPLWAQRLGRSDPLAQPPNWPSTPDAGMRLAVELSDFTHRQLIDSVRSQYPQASSDLVAKLAYDTLAAWERVRSSLRLGPRTPARGPI